MGQTDYSDKGRSLEELDQVPGPEAEVVLSERILKAIDEEVDKADMSVTEEAKFYMELSKGITERIYDVIVR